jgi:hypothetical protein
MTKFAPVPKFAQGPEIPDMGYRVTDLGGGAYGITNGLVNTMFLVTRKGVVLGQPGSLQAQASILPIKLLRN